MLSGSQQGQPLGLDPFLCRLVMPLKASELLISNCGAVLLIILTVLAWILPLLENATVTLPGDFNKSESDTILSDAELFQYLLRYSLLVG